VNATCGECKKTRLTIDDHGNHMIKQDGIVENMSRIVEATDNQRKYLRNKVGSLDKEIEDKTILVEQIVE
jgi:hypothetical protein